MLGKTIHNYQIKGLLEEGGMGNVYIAEHIKLQNKRVAVKFLHINLADRPDLKKRFEKEAQTLDLLKHKNIVKIVDYGEFENRHYLTTEFIVGQTLDKYISQSTGPIPENKAVRIFKQILDAMEYSHSKNVIHRDIKPSNIIITPEDKVVIIDFGIAKSIQENENMNLTGDGKRPGTVPYMSPEQVTGEKIGKSTDIYSLGVVLFQMVTGRHPYPDGKSAFHIHSKIVKEPLDRIRDIYPHCTDTMQQIIDKATAKKPSERYPTCGDFSKALDYKFSENANSEDTSISSESIQTERHQSKAYAEETEKTQIAQPTKIDQNPPVQPTVPKKNTGTKLVLIFLLSMIMIAGIAYFSGLFDTQKTVQTTTADIEENMSSEKKDNSKSENKTEKDPVSDNDLEDDKKEKKEEKPDSKTKKQPSKEKTETKHKSIVKTQSLEKNLNLLTNKSYSVSEKNKFAEELLSDFSANAIVEIENNGIVTETYPINEYLNNLKMLSGLKVIILDKQYTSNSKINLLKLTEK